MLYSLIGYYQSVHAAAVHNHRGRGKRGLPVDGRAGRRLGNAAGKRSERGPRHRAVRAV